MIERLRNQVDDARHVDQRFGSITVLDRLRSHIEQIEDLLSYSIVSAQRQALAGVLTEAATLGGWLALDRASIGQAWAMHERAKSAAREAEMPALLAHATAQQAFILIDMDELAAAAAAEQLAHAREIAEHTAPPLLRSWLAAAHGEGLAAQGGRDESLRAFDTANALLPNDPADPALPFLFLGGSYLARWRGNALSRLGEPDAIQELTDAPWQLPNTFTRAKAGMLVALVFAFAAAGDREQALSYARQAKRLGAQVKSDRQIRRLSGLILPTGVRSV